MITQRHHFRFESDSETRVLTKTLVSDEKKYESALAGEVKILKTLAQHPGFPHFLRAQKQTYQREFIPGRDLSELCGKLSWPELLEFTVQLARLIFFSHQNGIVLGDIKPQNIIISPESRLVFVDLSLAQELDQEEKQCGGSPAYMAPELFYGGQCSVASDLYAFGVTLYEMTSGRLPFLQRDFPSLARSHWCDEPQDPALHLPYPKAWSCLILRLMAKKVCDRFFNSNEIITFLNRNFHTQFELEPEKSSVTFFAHQASPAQIERHTLTVLISKTKREENEVELAAKIALKLGEYDIFESLLQEIPSEKALYLSACHHLNQGRVALAQSKAALLLERGESKAHHILGTCDYHKQEYESALRHYFKLLQHFRDKNKLSDMISVLNNLANTQVASKRMDLAKDYYQQSLALARLLGEVKQEALVLASQGYLEHHENRWGQALLSYEKSLQIYDWLGQAHSVLHNRLNLAGIWLSLGFVERAKDAILAIAEEARIQKNDLVLSYAFLAHGDVLKAERKKLQALAAYEQAHDLFLAQDNRSGAEASSVAQQRLRIETGEDVNFTEDSTVVRKQLSFFTLLNRIRNDADSQIADIEKLEAMLADQDLLLSGEDRLRSLQVLHNFFQKVKKTDKVRHYSQTFRDFKDRLAEGLAPAFRQKLDESYTLTEMSRAHDYSQALMDLSTSLIAELDIDELLQNILDKLIEYTHSERGFILLKEPQGNRMALSRHFDHKDLESHERQISWTLANQVLSTAQPLVTSDAAHDERFEITDSIHHLRLKSILCLPFVFRGEVLGAIYLDSKVARQQQEDLTMVLAPFTAQMAVAIFNARLFREAKTDLHHTQKELKKLKKTFQKTQKEQALSCHSASMQNVLNLARRVAQTSIPVLLTGESGVGKEKIARFIHENGVRSQQNFVCLNCGAIPENLLESELFGYKKGAFTGADRDKKGLLEIAHEGTLFLDEIGEMPLLMQVKILRILQEKEFLPLGSDRTVQTDVHVIAATNRNLVEEVRQKRFREDLYYRLQVAELHVPPLRERPEDIPFLAQHFLKHFSLKENLPLKRLSPKALSELMSYNWPGNVRELENMIYKMVVFHSGEVIDTIGFEKKTQTLSFVEISDRLNLSTLSLAEAKKLFEKNQITLALRHCKGNVSHAAKHLKMARPHLCALLKEHNINRLNFKDGRMVSDILILETAEKQ